MRWSIVILAVILMLSFVMILKGIGIGFVTFAFTSGWFLGAYNMFRRD